MFELESKGGGIACVLLALLLTGTWPAILTLLERRGRLPQHTYLDFTITNLLAALIMVFAFGEAGKNSNENPNFLNQLPQVSRLPLGVFCIPFLDNWSSVSFALAAGVFLSLGNISIQYALALVGLAVTLVISLSISIVIGTTLNFFLDDQINKAQILFPGVGCFVIAVFLGFAVHTSNSADDRDKLLNRSNDFKEAKGYKSINLTEVYTAYFHFSISSFVVAIFLNVMFLYRPAMGSSSSSLGAYISDWKGRGCVGWEMAHSSLVVKLLDIQHTQISAEMLMVLEDGKNDNWPSILFAVAGGVVLSLGNLSTQYAWAFVGLSVTEVVTASITVVIGTTMNYFLDGKINRAEILFPGVGCFLIAVFLAAAVHESNASDNKAKLSSVSTDPKNEAGLYDNSMFDEKYKSSVTKDVEDLSTIEEEMPEFGTADFLIDLENKRAIKVLGKSTFIGLAITLFAGACLSLFSPAFNLATNDQWHALKDGVPHLTVYTAFFFFSLSCFIIAIILNINFLYRPVLDLPKSSIKAYLADWNGRKWALLAGLLCGFGNGLQFMGGQAAGYAAADAVQALPLVSTFWGILLFGEYRRSSRRTYIYLSSMLLMFIVAVSILMASAGQRTAEKLQSPTHRG
ncbi:hypothetical protein Leryth_015752 [Lithospermum erythrorhizon]|nr:hypothetical protein Leryth_015752 [Lithospermum erythrorhizon]